MKRIICGVVSIATVVAGLMLTGCKTHLAEEKVEKYSSDSEISERIMELKEAGLFENILSAGSYGKCKKFNFRNEFYLWKKYHV